MSILDSLLNAAEQHPEVNTQQHSALLNTAIEMFGNSGGMSSFLHNAQSQGLGDIVNSWISTGDNQSVSADQVQRVVGNWQAELESRPAWPEKRLPKFCRCWWTSSLRAENCRKLLNEEIRRRLV